MTVRELIELLLADDVNLDCIVRVEDKEGKVERAVGIDIMESYGFIDIVCFDADRTPKAKS